jgi:hypothetical protein
VVAAAARALFAPHSHRHLVGGIPTNRVVRGDILEYHGYTAAKFESDVRGDHGGDVVWRGSGQWLLPSRQEAGPAPFGRPPGGRRCPRLTTGICIRAGHRRCRTRYTRASARSQHALNTHARVALSRAHVHPHRSQVVGQYELGKVIGAGAFSKVRIATKVGGKDLFAVKIVLKDSIRDIRDLERSECPGCPQPHRGPTAPAQLGAVAMQLCLMRMRVRARSCACPIISNQLQQGDARDARAQELEPPERHQHARVCREGLQALPRPRLCRGRRYCVFHCPVLL